MDGDVKQFLHLLIYCCHMNTIASITVLTQMTFKNLQSVCSVLVWGNLIIIIASPDWLKVKYNINRIKNRNFTATATDYLQII